MDRQLTANSEVQEALRETAAVGVVPGWKVVPRERTVANRSHARQIPADLHAMRAASTSLFEAGAESLTTA